MFRFADRYDKIMMVLGTIGGLALGGAISVVFLFLGQITNVFSLSTDIIV
jgi:hypothetical protein